MIAAPLTHSPAHVLTFSVCLSSASACSLAAFFCSADSPRTASRACFVSASYFMTTRPTRSPKRPMAQPSLGRLGSCACASIAPSRAAHADRSARVGSASQ
jgi:hypothetical protein